MKKSISKLQTYLTLIFVVCFLISNILASKQFQLPFNVTMPAAVIVFPITYILSDIFSEVYGYKWSRITCYMAFLANLFMVICFQIAIAMPSASYWQNQDAFNLILGSAPRTLVASLAGYVAGDFINDVVFQKMKTKHQDLKGFKARAILSSLVGEMCDSCIFLPIAFIGLMPAKALVTMGFWQVIIKVSYEIIILPVTALVARKVSKYEVNNNG